MFGITFSSPTISGFAVSSFRVIFSAEPTAAVTGSRWLLQMIVLSFRPEVSAPRSGTVKCVSKVPILPLMFSRTTNFM